MKRRRSLRGLAGERAGIASEAATGQEVVGASRLIVSSKKIV
jgi:hypothetical protein